MSFFLMGDDCALYWDKMNNTPAALASINQRELLAIHPNPRDSLIKWLTKSYSTDELQRMESLIKDKLGDFVPDVIFTISPTPFLEHLYPDALVLYRDAMYCREPWPDEMTCFDPIGLNLNSLIGKYGKKLSTVTTKTDEFFCNALREFIKIDPVIRSFYLRMIAKYKYYFDKLILLPLQSNGHYNFYSATMFASQFDYLCYILDHTPSNIGIIVTEHPDDNTLTEETVRYLRATYKKFYIFRRAQRSSFTFSIFTEFCKWHDLCKFRSLLSGHVIKKTCLYSRKFTV
ncbi:hypothetical protein ABK905_17755 [Acerihabitans sp. KWT182]|uniref:Uncharacterized protein n=1 Tax=Acerihabitans sp. KWT182 TaxID=3157919 RepID=A0AAU7Q804_9GAMM